MQKTLKIIIYLSLSIFALAFIFRIFIPEGYYGFMGGYRHHMFSGGIFSLGMMGMGFFWLVVILLALQWFGNQNYKETHLESLKKRLSRGEITVEEYEKIKEKMKE